RADVPYPAAAPGPAAVATKAVASAMITLVCTEVTAATAPTLRISRNNGQPGRVGRNRAILRPDRMYQASTAVPPPYTKTSAAPHATAGNTDGGARADAEAQQRRHRHQHPDADADPKCRDNHIAGTGEDARQAVEQPEQHAAGEHHVRIGHGRVEFAARAAERTIDRPAEAEHDAAEHSAEHDMDDDGVHRQRIGLVGLAAAERAPGPRRDAPPQ